MRALFGLLDPADLDGSYQDWLVAVTAIVQAQQAKSAALAATYVSVLRATEFGLDPNYTPTTAGPINPVQLATSMLVTGPVSIRANLGRGMTLAQALDIAEGSSAAAAMRLALNGGRDTILASVKADRRSAGWQRVTSGNSCDFCSMLADRGAVYRESSSDFQAHDGCSCSAEPVYA